MAATRRKARKKPAKPAPAPPAKAGLFSTLGTRIKKLATGLVKRKKRKPKPKARKRKTAK